MLILPLKISELNKGRHYNLLMLPLEIFVPNKGNCNSNMLISPWKIYQPYSVHYSNQICYRAGNLNMSPANQQVAFTCPLLISR